MTRTQVQLTDDQLTALRRLSAESGKSVAEFVRLGVEMYLRSHPVSGRKQQNERAQRVIGKFRSGLTDVGRNHDRYLAEAFEK